MNVDTATIALVCAVQGLASGFVPGRRRWLCLAIFGAAMLAGMAVAASIADRIFPQCSGGVRGWAALAAIGCAVSTHLADSAIRRAAPLFALNAGLCCGVAAICAGASELAWALPWLSLALPARWAVERGGALAVKIVCSWLLAVLVLAAAMSFMAVTPGYMPDHLE